MFGIMGATWRHPVVAQRQQDVAGRQPVAAVRIPRSYYRK